MSRSQTSTPPLTTSKEANYSWVQLDPAKLRNIGGESPNRLAIRVYGVHGEAFPRLTISVWKNGVLYSEGGIKIAASLKRGPGAAHWWEEYTIPTTLLPVVKELIDEALIKLADE